MMNIKLLSNERIDVVHKAFVEAFSDYAVQIKMPIEKFMEMVVTRSLNLEYSIGCYDNEKLIGFILSGFREIEHITYCYDGGTGVIKEFRRKGIAENLLKELIDIFHKRNIKYFVLEVLENNEPAINLYKKYGFEITRKLKCYECDRDMLTSKNSHRYIVSNDTSVLNGLDPNDYSLYRPSWQNDDISIRNAADNYSFVFLSSNSKVICYGSIHKVKGDIPQICLLNEFRNTELEKILLSELIKNTTSGKISLINVEDASYLCKTLEEIGFHTIVNQYEMKLDISQI